LSEKELKEQRWTLDGECAKTESHVILIKRFGCYDNEVSDKKTEKKRPKTVKGNEKKSTKYLKKQLRVMTFEWSQNGGD
jgi:hypothetical protein